MNSVNGIVEILHLIADLSNVVIGVLDLGSQTRNGRQRLFQFAFQSRVHARAQHANPGIRPAGRVESLLHQRLDGGHLLIDRALQSAKLILHLGDVAFAFPAAPCWRQKRSQRRGEAVPLRKMESSAFVSLLSLILVTQVLLRAICSANY